MPISDEEKHKLKRQERRKLRAGASPDGLKEKKGPSPNPSPKAEEKGASQARFKRYEAEAKEKKLSPVSPDKFNDKQGNQLLSRVTKRLEKFKAKHPGASDEKMQRKAAKFAEGTSYRMGVRSALRANAKTPDQAVENGTGGLGQTPKPPRDREARR